MTQAATEQEQAKLKIKDLEARIAKDEPRAKKAADQNKSLLSALENLRTDSAKIRQQLARLGWEEGKDHDMKQRKTQLQENIRKLTEVRCPLTEVSNVKAIRCIKEKDCKYRLLLF